MFIQVSIGEVIDKFSILELKLKKISDEIKRTEIEREIESLSECIIYKTTYSFFYNLLTYVNEQIWDMTNEIKSKTIEDEQFAIISNNIFEFNQKRYRIKNWFNIITESQLKEQKSYSSTYCKIIIENEETIFNKIAEIHYLALEYDYVYFETPFLNTIQRIFSIPTFLYCSDAKDIVTYMSIQLENYVINDNIKYIFELQPIKYLMGGLFGDFIQTLSIINEKFHTTGRKGIVYLSNKGDCFRNGLHNTFYDTHAIIKDQKYIHNYMIYNSEEYDIDLTEWRNDLINIDSSYNWSDVFNKKYNVIWGQHKWISVQENEMFKEFILINTTDYRWPNDINFKAIYETYGNNVKFIGSNINQYQFFINTTSINIDFIECDTFEKLCSAINSCKLFIGSLSGPLSIAHACHKNRIIGLHAINIDSQLNLNLDKLWSNVKYTF
jgi:hypothetical protein